jgi:molybdenum cofactor guanylyltransferase
MAVDIEAVLLTGGASRRMGSDKSKLSIGGEPLAVRICRLLSEAGLPVTVSGRERIDGYAFLADAEEFAGPLGALARFKPSRDLVFVVSCDLPGFDAQIVSELAQSINGYEAAIPIVDGKLQPLCALYTDSAFDAARALAAGGEKRVMQWVEGLNIVAVETLRPESLSNVNTPEQLEGWQVREPGPGRPE